MWSEPLAAETAAVDTHTVAVTVRDSAGRAVAEVQCLHNARAGFGVFGEMRVIDGGGAPRQRVRALVLLVREALRYAESIGVTQVMTEAPERLWPFAARVSGVAGAPTGARYRFAGELHAVRTAALRATRENGVFQDPMPYEEELALDAAIDLRR
jgi:hypothetical protein